MKIAILEAQLSPGGKSAALAEIVGEILARDEHEPRVHHAGEFRPVEGEAPSPSGRDGEDEVLAEQLASAEAIVLIAPVRGNDLAASAREVVALNAGSWAGKAVGLVCLANRECAEAGPTEFINWLSMDCHCLVSPRWVCVAREEFGDDNRLPGDSPVRDRLGFMVRGLPLLAEAGARNAAIEESP